jgi:arylsulfatase A-like enzyme
MSRFLKRSSGSIFNKPAAAVISILVFVLIAGIFLVTRNEGRRPVERQDKNTSAQKPNVVLITMDTVRADHLSCYGYPRQTSPHVDNLARDAVIFKNAHATTSWTLPSHASIFTGLYPSRHGADRKSDDSPAINSVDKNLNYWNKMMLSNFTRLSGAHHTLAEILKDGGYKTAGIIGGIFCTSIFGLEQGFDYYDDEIPSFNINFFALYQAIDMFFSLDDIFSQQGYLGKRIAVHLNDSAYPWLEKNSAQPFFLFINYMDAHTPYLPPQSYGRYFTTIPKEIIKKRNPPFDVSYISAETRLMNAVTYNGQHLTKEEKELIMGQYDGGIRYLDDYLGRLFDKLKALNVYDNTLIIITSDHGEAFGEHNHMEHGRTLYEEVLRVPLIIKYPAPYQRRGLIEKRVSLVDLLPTVLAFLNYPVPADIDGKTIEALPADIFAELKLTPEETRKKELRDLKALYEGKEKYIWSSDGAGELYNLEADPLEEQNLFGTYPLRVEVMDKTLKNWVASFKGRNIEGEKAQIDNQALEKLRALGYVE